MGDNKGDEKRDDSYFAAARRKRKRSLRIIIPIAAAAIILGVVIGTQAQEHGIGAKIIYHIHPRLNVTVDGKPVTLPTNIGINSTLYKDHSQDKYSMPGTAPLHTHDSSGNVHVESTVNRNYTLGEFLNIWLGPDLNGKTVKTTVDGKPVSDFRYHVFRDKEQINLAINK
jgi:hypothetical protein